MLVLHGSCYALASARQFLRSSSTYVLDVDGWVGLATGGNAISELVWRDCLGGRWATGSAAVAAWATVACSSEVASKVATTSVATTVAATTCEATASAKAAAAESSTEASTVSTAAVASSTGVAVLANFKHTALPVVAVELYDGVLRVLRSVELDNARALWRSVWSAVDVGAKDVSCNYREYVHEETFTILDAHLLHGRDP